MLLSEFTNASLLREGVFLTPISLHEQERLLDLGLGGLYSVYSDIDQRETFRPKRDCAIL